LKRANFVAGTVAGVLSGLISPASWRLLPTMLPTDELSCGYHGWWLLRAASGPMAALFRVAPLINRFDTALISRFRPACLTRVLSMCR